MLDVYFPSLTSYCLSVRKLVIHGQMEVGTEREQCQFILKCVQDDGVKSETEVYKQDPQISQHCNGVNTGTFHLTIDYKSVAIVINDSPVFVLFFPMYLSFPNFEWTIRHC